MRVRSARARRLLLTLLVLPACAVFPSCSEEDPVPARGVPVSAYALVGPEEPASGLAIALDQCAAWLEQATSLPVVRAVTADLSGLSAGTYVIALGANRLTESLIPPAEREGLADEGYVLRTGSFQGLPVFAGAGADDLGDQYASYEILTRLGFGFYHPEETYVPDELDLPDAPVDETWEPDYSWRGIHVHTQHPNEYVLILLEASPYHLDEAQAFIDWIVANRQNFFEWALLATVDLDAWIPFASEIVAYGHERGIKLGIDAPLEFKQENAYPLVPDPDAPWEPQLRSNLDRIMDAGWDVIHVEMGAAEFIPTDDVKQFDMMNEAGDYLAEVYGAELTVKVHCTSNQTAPNFGDINFNFLPGLCNPNVGVAVHTVQFYDLYGPAPTYGNEDFSAWRAFLLDQVGRRLDLYYPETGYFITFDTTVPLYLPAYLYARWNDLHRLEGSGIDGQVDFLTGLEWGYWLPNYAMMAHTFDATADWTTYLKRFTRIFGDGAEAMQALLQDVILEQREDLVELVLPAPPEQHALMGYLIGHNSTTDFGARIADEWYIPTRVEFRDVYRMGRDELAAFAGYELELLAGLAATYDAFRERAASIEARIPEKAWKWYMEVRRGIDVTGLRARQMHALYEGVVLVRRAELGLDPEGASKARAWFEEARAARREAHALILEQERDYRFSPDLIAAGPLDNPSVYKYGMFYPASIAFFWRRAEARAIDRDACICLLNIDDMLAALFGETTETYLVLHGVLLLLFQNVECLNLCVDPEIPPA